MKLVPKNETSEIGKAGVPFDKGHFNELHVAGKNISDVPAPYEHTQGASSATWTVSHNLGYKPNVKVYTVGGVERLAEIIHLSDTVLEIRFAAPTTGTARML